MSTSVEIIETAAKAQLPSGWTLKTIEDLVGDNGIFVDGDWVESKDQDPEGDVRLIQLADIGDGAYRDRSARFLTHAKAIELGCTFLKKGDVLIARMPDPLGRACTFPGDSRPAVTVVDVAIVRSAEGDFNHRWLMHFVNAPAFRSAVAGMQSGSTRKRISRGNLAKIALPVPPVDQQERIVAEIETQLSRLDEGVTNLSRTKANLKRYKAAVLQAAVEGRLVETEAELARREGRTYETGASVVRNVLERRARVWQSLRKYREPAQFTDSPKHLVPDGWAWCSLEQLTRPDRPCAYGVLQPGDDVASGVPFVRVGDVEDGKIAIDDLKRISPTVAARYPRTLLEGGEVLITLVGAIGRTAVVPPALSGANVARAVAVLPVTPDVDARWVELWLRSPARTAEMTQAAHEVARKTLNLEDVRRLKVLIPPLSEQRRIVMMADSLISLANAQERLIDHAVQRSVRLRAAILSSAFLPATGQQ